MKSILMSIQPKLVAKILNGEKTIEIRKTMPKCDLPIDVYIYCTKGKPYLYKDYDEDITGDKVFTDIEKPQPNEEQYLGGKVVAKFTLNKISGVHYHKEESKKTKQFEEKSCVSDEEMNKYLGIEEKDLVEGKMYAYAWHIDNLEIFDRPKELWEFKTPENAKRYKRDLEKAYKMDEEISERIYNNLAFEDECANCVELTEMSEGYYGLTKAPQSWQYIEMVK